ncbi:MAG: hypothetical protein SPI20_07340 [Ruminococcus callidus]|nr:hypothetical protein [Ruminococcus callidus]
MESIPIITAVPNPNISSNTYFSNTSCFLEHGNVISQAFVSSCCSNINADHGIKVKKNGSSAEMPLNKMEKWSNLSKLKIAITVTAAKIPIKMKIAAFNAFKSFHRIPSIKLSPFYI